MNNGLKMKLEDCDNHYSVEDLYDRFGMYDEETKICMNCRNHRIEGGIITCKYIIERVSNTDEGSES